MMGSRRSSRIGLPRTIATVVPRRRPVARWTIVALVLLTATSAPTAISHQPSADAANPETSWAKNGASQDTVLVRFEESSRSGRDGQNGRWVRVPIDPQDDPADAFEQLSLTPGIAEIAPEFKYYETSVPNDPSYEDQWHLRKIGLESAWEEVDGSGVTVAVIDS